MSTNLFSAADREVIAAHIGEMELTDAVLQRFFDSAIEQAIEKHEKALEAYRRALTMEREEGEPEPVPPVVPTPEDAVSAMMVNLRAALDVHTGDDGRARAFEDEMAKAIDEAELINAAVDILDARYRKAAPAPDPHNFPENLSDKLSDWDTGADENNLTTADLTEDVILPVTEAVDPEERDRIVNGFIDILKAGKPAAEDAFRQLSSEDRVRLFPLLNAELSRLNNQEALLGRSIPRKADVENLIGILARVGEA